MQPSTLARTQGAYYVCTGLWPLLHMSSFLKVTGPKTDLWLVQTVGVLVTCIGGQLVLSGPRAEQLRPLATAAALGLAAVEVIHVSRKRISPVYLLDAIAEVGMAFLWGRPLQNKRQRAA